MSSLAVVPATEDADPIERGLVRSGAGLVPVAGPRSSFMRYQRREGVLVNVGAGLVFGTAIGTAALSTLAFGPLWGVGLLGLGFASVAWMANTWGLVGNRTLAEHLRDELGLSGADWSFVGFCRADQNRLSAKLLPPRVETDENVGFLRLTDTALELRMEGVERSIKRESIRDVRLEEVVEAPFLEWVRIEVFEEDGTLNAFLTMAREGTTLHEQSHANRALFERLREWHVSDKLRPLVEAGELPAQVLNVDDAPTSAEG